LEQYVLGLTDRDESDLVKRMADENPQIRHEIARLQEEMSAYAMAKNILPPPRGRKIRHPEEYDNLDHEVIMAMTERNHTLTIWRYALSAACFLLLLLSGYLFRSNQLNHNELVKERAIHAQDENTHQIALQHLEEGALDWASLQTLRKDAKVGHLQVHHFPNRKTVLIDLSDFNPPADGHAYFIVLGSGQEVIPALEITYEGQHTLYPIELAGGKDTLRVFHWPVGQPVLPAVPSEDLVAEAQFVINE
ncbi:MAG: hypothetical protein AAFP02_23605, partial [Bacteroidota bacterium]